MSTLPLLFAAAVTVAFPRAGQVLPAVSRTYVIGAADGVTNLVVAGKAVTPYRTGAWTAFLPVVEGTNRLMIVSTAEGVVQTNELVFSVTPRVKKYEKLAYAKDAPSAEARAKDPSETLIFLDPGHGGSDTGAVSPHGYFEKNANLLLAQATAEALRARGYRVSLTRADDRPIELYERAREAHAAGADAFVSIHHNAPAVDAEATVRYSSVYSWNALGDPLARVLAERLAQSGADEPTSRGALRANFAVTRSPEIPSCLVEADFITAPAGEEASFDPAVSRRRGAALAEGIDAWCRSRAP